MSASRPAIASAPCPPSSPASRTRPVLKTRSPSPERFARAAGADVVAVCAFPYDDRPEAHFNLDDAPAAAGARRYHARPAVRAAQRRPARAPRSPSPTFHPPARSTHRGREDAALIVVGPSHAGPTRACIPAAPPSGCCRAHRAPSRSRRSATACARPRSSQRISVGLRRLRRRRPRARRPACSSPRAAGAPLRVIRVFTPRLARRRRRCSRVPGYLRLTPAAEQAAREELERTVAALPERRLGRARVPARRPRARARARVRGGRPARDRLARLRAAARRCCSAASPARVARTAACPLLIVPARRRRAARRAVRPRSAGNYGYARRRDPDRAAARPGVSLHVVTSASPERRRPAPSAPIAARPRSSSPTTTPSSARGCGC